MSFTPSGVTCHSFTEGTLSPTLIVIAASFRSVLLDMENRFAGDPPLAQQRTDTRKIAPAMLGDDRPQRIVRGQPGEQCQIGAEAVLGLRGEIMEGLDAGVLVLAELAE